MSSSCDEVPNIIYCPKSQVVKWKYWPKLQSCIWKSNTASALKSRSVTFFSSSCSLLIVGGATTFTSCSRCGYALSSLCHSGVEAVPLVKSEKERFPRSFSKEGFVAPLSLHLRTTWARDPSFWDILYTTPNIYSTIPILPRPIKEGSYPWLRKRARLCRCIVILA